MLDGVMLTCLAGLLLLPFGDYATRTCDASEVTLTFALSVLDEALQVYAMTMKSVLIQLCKMLHVKAHFFWKRMDG